MDVGRPRSMQARQSAAALPARLDTSRWKQYSNRCPRVLCHSSARYHQVQPHRAHRWHAKYTFCWSQQLWACISSPAAGSEHHKHLRRTLEGRGGSCCLLQAEASRLLLGRGSLQSRSPQVESPSLLRGLAVRPPSQGLRRLLPLLTSKNNGLRLGYGMKQQV